MGKMVFISDEQCVYQEKKVYQKCLFQQSGDQNFKKFPSVSYLLNKK